MKRQAGQPQQLPSRGAPPAVPWTAPEIAWTCACAALVQQRQNQMTSVRATLRKPLLPPPTRLLWDRVPLAAPVALAQPPTHMYT